MCTTAAMLAEALSPFQAIETIGVFPFLEEKKTKHWCRRSKSGCRKRRKKKQPYVAERAKQLFATSRTERAQTLLYTTRLPDPETRIGNQDPKPRYDTQLYRGGPKPWFKPPKSWCRRSKSGCRKRRKKQQPCVAKWPSPRLRRRL